MKLNSWKVCWKSKLIFWNHILKKSRFIKDDDEQSYAEKITNTIINNIQIYLKNIHIRYEDNYSIKNKNVSFGLFLKEFKAETVDAEGRRNFLNAEEKIIYKQGILNGFNLYWNADNSHTHKDSLIIQQKEFSGGLKDRSYCVVSQVYCPIKNSLSFLRFRTILLMCLSVYPSVCDIYIN